MIKFVINHIYEIFSKNSLDFELNIKELKGGKTSVSFYGAVAFYLTCVKSNEYIEFPERYAKYVPDKFNPHIRKNGLVRIMLSDCKLYEMDFFNIINSIYKYCHENRAFEFDCCSMYNECSDARKCVNTDRELMLKCRYCAKLEKGIIFYGANRNV